jgi:transposase
MISQLGLLIESSSDRLTPLAIGLLGDLREELQAVMARISAMDRKIEAVFKAHPTCQLLETIPGVGVMTATAVYAAVVDAKQFKNGRAFSSWLGLVPRQYSTGGRSTLLGISKRGDSYLRKLVVHGARAMTGMPGRRSPWMQEVEKRRGRNKAVVAQANKNARIMWAVMARQEGYRSAA